VSHEIRPAVEADQTEAEARFVARATTAFVVLGLLLRLLRYLMDYPLWCDESRLAANLVDSGFADLGKPLRYAQVAPVGYLAVEMALIDLLGFSTRSLRLFALVCSLTSVLVFRHVAGRLVSGLPALLAVAIFAVSWWPITFSAEVKPYAGDLFVALGLTAMGIEWLRRRDRTIWLWALAAAATVAIPLSFPSAFVVGGIVLGLSAPAWATRRIGARAAFLTLALAPALTFAALLPVYQIDDKLQGYLDHYWSDAFPPTDGLGRLLVWLARMHTGNLFAYPIGCQSGGSTLTTLCFLVGVFSFRARDRRAILTIGLAPLALALLAAALHKYPYGVKPRTMQFFVPAVCLFSALGLAGCIGRLGSLRARKLAVRAALAAYLALAVFHVGAAILHPYQIERDEHFRAFASWFWRELSHDAELVCARSDLGVVTRPEHWNGNWTDYFLCYERIYLSRRRRNTPIRFDALSDTHPLRCVFFNEIPEDTPSFRAWMNEMGKSYIYRGVQSYTVRVKDHNAPNILNMYRVYEFTPRPDAVVASVRAVEIAAEAAGRVRRLRRVPPRTETSIASWTLQSTWPAPRVETRPEPVMMRWDQACARSASRHAGGCDRRIRGRRGSIDRWHGHGESAGSPASRSTSTGRS
jgi:hypothetical protein